MIDDSTILQTNAAIIAGLLILLTLLSYKREQPATTTTGQVGDIKEEKDVINTLSFVTIGGIIPFSVSALITIIWENIDAAKILMALGFVWLIVGVPLIVLTSRRISLPQNELVKQIISLRNAIEKLTKV